MRGEDRQQQEMFLYATLEDLVPPGSPAAAHPGDGRSRARGPRRPLGRDLRRRRAAVDRARAAAAGAAADAAGLDPQRADAGGAAALQPAVPVVRGAGHERRGVARDGVHQEPRPAAGGRGGAGVLRRGGAAGAAAGADVERAFLGGRDDAGGVGEPEELPARSRASRAKMGRASCGRGCGCATCAPRCGACCS
jgi:hypothetical protein